jgi:hypothetical protein
LIKKTEGPDVPVSSRCSKEVSAAAMKLASVVAVTQVQEKRGTYWNVPLATHRTMQKLLEKVTAIEVRLGRLQLSLAKREALESEGTGDDDAPKSEKK